MRYVVHIHEAEGRLAKASSNDGVVRITTPALERFNGKPIENLMRFLKTNKIQWEVYP